MDAAAVRARAVHYAVSDIAGKRVELLRIGAPYADARGATCVTAGHFPVLVKRVLCEGAGHTRAPRYPATALNGKVLVASQGPSSKRHGVDLEEVGHLRRPARTDETDVVWMGVVGVIRGSVSELHRQAEP